MKLNHKIFLSLAMILSLGVLTACGDGKEALVRKLCKEQLAKNAQFTSLPSDQQETFLNLCVQEASKKLQELK